MTNACASSRWVIVVAVRRLAEGGGPRRPLITFIPLSGGQLAMNPRKLLLSLPLHFLEIVILGILHEPTGDLS